MSMTSMSAGGVDAMAPTAPDKKKQCHSLSARDVWAVKSAHWQCQKRIDKQKQVSTDSDC